MTQQKGFSAIEILVAITILVILASGVWVWGRIQREPTGGLISAPAPSEISKLTTLPTDINQPTLTPVNEVTLSALTPAPTEPADLPTEIISHNPKNSWSTHTDDIAGFKIQYPPNHKLGDQIKEGSNIYFLSCGWKNPNTEEDLCLSGFTIDIYHDYDGRSRRVWLNSKMSFYKPYYQNWIVDGKKALVAIEGNPGGSSWVSVAIPNGSLMVIIGEVGPSWDPDTGLVPDLKYLKEILSTFKFLD